MKNINYLLIFLCLFLMNKAWGQLSITQNDTTVCKSTTLSNVCATQPSSINTNLYLDDQFSNVINIGFNFNFWGNNYNKVVISDNNFISFNQTLANQYSHFIYASAYNNGQLTNSICAPFMDLYNQNGTGGLIRYITVGNAPYRKFIVEFCNVKYFGPECNAYRATSQIILYETTNVIETHILQANRCVNYFNSNSNTIMYHGLVGPTNQVLNVAGQGVGSNFSITAPLGTRFSPSGNSYQIAAITYNPYEIVNTNGTFQWFKNNATTPFATTNCVNIPIDTGHTQYIVKYVGTAGCNTTQTKTLYDTLHTYFNIPTVDTVVKFCANQLPTTWNNITIPANAVTQNNFATYHKVGIGTQCDTNFRINLVINPIKTGTQNATICQGQSYVFNGITYTSANNTAKDTFVSSNGCDSIVTLNLTVNPTKTGTQNATICQGQSYIFNGITYTSANNSAKDTFIASNGCDSIVTLNLTVNPTKTGTQNATICQGQSYLFNGINYTSNNNTAKDTFIASNGCDSIVTLNLTVTPALTGTETVTICQGQSYVFNGVTYTSSNTTAKDTFQTIGGCDSIVTLNLTVTPALTGTQSVSICQGQSYVFNGVTYTNSNNTAKDTFQTSGGCDSIVTLNLTVTPALTGTETVTICQGQSYVFNGVTYTSSNNTAKDTFQTSGGCDSIVTLNLTVTPALTGSQTVTICQGQSYVFNGVTYTSSNNTAKDTFQTLSGCDSIVTLNLMVNLIKYGTQSISICEGEAYVFNGITYTTANTTAKDTLVSINGCDSIVTLNLSIKPKKYGVQNVNLCFGETYTFNGITYTSSNTTAKDTLVASNGCDSIVSLNLSISNFNPAITNLDLFGCNEVIYNGQYYYQSTTLSDTLRTVSGCDSLVTHVNIVVANNEIQESTIDYFGCDSISFRDKMYYEDIIITDSFQDRNGCDSAYLHHHIQVEHFNIDLIDNPEQPYKGERIDITVEGNEEFLVNSWNPTILFPNQHITRQGITLHNPTEIIVVATSKNKCTDTAKVTIIPIDMDKQIIIPTAFTPNGDGRNDYFKPLLKMERAYRKIVFEVYNRWGNKVYDGLFDQQGWDGNYNGNPCDAGVYYYILKIIFDDTETKELKGDITLIR